MDAACFSTVHVHRPDLADEAGVEPTVLVIPRVRLVSIQLHAVFVGLPSRMVGFPGAPVGEAFTDRYLGA